MFPAAKEPDWPLRPPGALARAGGERYGQRAGPDRNGLAGVTLNGAGATLQGGAFAADVPVPEGASTVIVQATDLAGNSAALNVAVERFTLPVVAISTPRI